MEELGNPGGKGMINVSQTTSLSGSNGTGGLLIIYANTFINNSNIESKGSKGGDGYNYGGQGGSSGGGSINIFYNNKGTTSTIDASGGIANSQGGAGRKWNNICWKCFFRKFYTRIIILVKETSKIVSFLCGKIVNL